MKTSIFRISQLDSDDPNFVGNIQSIIVRSQSNICLLLSVRPDQGVDLSHVSVTELLHSLFNLVLVGLDIHSEHQCVVVFCLLHGWLSGEGELDGGTVVKLFSPRGALPRICALPPEPQCFGPSEGGWRPDLLFFVAVYAFQHSFLGLQSLCFGLCFGRGRGFLLHLWRHLREKSEIR